MTLLEASAGTGKTFTIAALTARYIAEEAKPIDRLLVITFTRMATGELRERVRERLMRAHDDLTDVLAGAGIPANDEIVARLADAPQSERVARQERLAKAIASFDAATIETTHGFCLQVLYGLGTAGDVDREVTLVEDVRDLLQEVVDDLYLRKFVHHPSLVEFTYSDALNVAGKVLDNPDSVVLPSLSDGEDVTSVRRRFAKTFEEEIDRRKKTLKIMTYDDVLLRLRDTLADPIRGPEARRRLRDRYDVVLVDEFQDTDLVQWEIMRRAFGGAGTTLVLIGDPKQAIYAFRGADVHTYLQAKEEVEAEWTLGVNWRSDKALLDAYDALFGNAQLGQAGIDYRSVQAAPSNVAARLVGAPVSAPLRARIVHAGDGLVRLTNDGKPRAAEARACIATDLAGEVVGLLTSGAELITRSRDGEELERTKINPGHIAVLVRYNAHAITVRDALHGAGVPAVIGGAGSVFVSDAAFDWLRLLEALERPAARDRASLAALTPFIGWLAEQVAQASEDEWEDLHWALHRWAALLRDKGVAALHEAVGSAGGVSARVLARPDGERFMTDLRHVAQLLHEAGVSEGVGPTAMANWLGRRIREADRDTDNEERTRRLESDAHAVQVITIHRSKGLEFPIVLCPYAWDGYIRQIDVPVFHDPDNGNRRTVYVGKGSDLESHKKQEKAEGQGESLRLLYVALTRARHQAVVWWAGGRDTKDSPLSRLLLDRTGSGEVPAYGPRKVPSDAAVEAAFTALGPDVSVERVTGRPAARWHSEEDGTPDLRAAVFDRALDTSWGRVSYSAVTSDAYEQPVIGSEPEETLTTDEGETPEVPAPSGAGAIPSANRPPSVALGLGAMSGGTLVGTVVHEVLRRADFAATDLGSEVAAALTLETTRRNVVFEDPGAVVHGLTLAIESPLGPAVGDLRLRDIPRSNRVDELGFEIPLVGGDVPSGRVEVADIADVLDAHLHPGDPVARYARRLRDPVLGRRLRGYLTGSLDLVFRCGDRFVLADYKTNRLGLADENLTSWHYRPDAIEAEMAGSHYPLQALLYSVALHRYLRWRLPGYVADRHFGGVLYLFLRGMSAVETVRHGEQPCGVWSWRPPAQLVEALSDLFDEGVRP